MISESVHKLYFLLIVREFIFRYLISIDGLNLETLEIIVLRYTIYLKEKSKIFPISLII
jgi:hypothetical protein